VLQLTKFSPERKTAYFWMAKIALSYENCPGTESKSNNVGEVASFDARGKFTWTSSYFYRFHNSSRSSDFCEVTVVVDAMLAF
jgi:hypothetical protein